MYRAERAAILQSISSGSDGLLAHGLRLRQRARPWSGDGAARAAA
jgi:hypothetical protein